MQSKRENLGKIHSKKFQKVLKNEYNLCLKENGTVRKYLFEKKLKKNFVKENLKFDKCGLYFVARNFLILLHFINLCIINVLFKAILHHFLNIC